MIYLNLKRIGLIQKLVVLTLFSFFYVSQYAYSIVCSDALNSPQNSGSNTEIKNVRRPEMSPLTRFDAQTRVIEEKNPQFNAIRDTIKEIIKNTMVISEKSSLNSSGSIYGIGLIGDVNVRRRLRELKTLVEFLNDSTEGGVLDKVGGYDRKSPQFNKDNFDNIVQILKIVTHVDYRENLLTEMFLHPKESLENILVGEIKKLRHNFSNLEALILIQKYLDNYTQNYSSEGIPRLLKKYKVLPEDTLINSYQFLRPDNPFAVKHKISDAGSTVLVRAKVNFLQKNGESAEVWTNVAINREVLLHNLKTGESKLARSTAKVVYFTLPGGGTITDNLPVETVSHLAKYNIDVISIVHFLHGGGPCVGPACMNLEDFISFIVAFVKKYLPGNVRIIFGGHSFGGAIVEAIRRESFKKDSFFNPELGRVLGLFVQSSLFLPHIEPPALKHESLTKVDEHNRTYNGNQVAPAEKIFLRILFMNRGISLLGSVYSMRIILQIIQKELRNEEKSTKGLPTLFMVGDKDELVHLGFNDGEVLRRILKIVTGEDHDTVKGYDEHYRGLPNSTFVLLRELPFRGEIFANGNGEELPYAPVGHLLANYFVTKNALEKLKEDPTVRDFLNKSHRSPMEGLFEPVNHYFLRQFASQMLGQDLKIERDTRKTMSKEEPLLEILQLFSMDFSFRRWVSSRTINILERTSKYKTDKRELQLDVAKQNKGGEKNSRNKKQGSDKKQGTENPVLTTMGDKLISNLQFFSFREKVQRLLKDGLQEVMDNNFDNVELIKNLRGQINNMLEFLSKNEGDVLVELLRLYSELVKTQENSLESQHVELKEWLEVPGYPEKVQHIRKTEERLNRQNVRRVLRAKILHARTDVLLAKNRHKENIAGSIFIQKKIKYLQDLKSEYLEKAISLVEMEIKNLELLFNEGDISVDSSNKKISEKNQEKERLEGFKKRGEYPEDLLTLIPEDGDGILSISHYFDVLNLLKELQRNLQMRSDKRGTVGTVAELEHIIERMRKAFGEIKSYKHPTIYKKNGEVKFTNLLEKGYIIDRVNEFIRSVNVEVVEYYKNYDSGGYKAGVGVVESSTNLKQHLKSKLQNFFQSNSFLGDNDFQIMVDLIMEYLTNLNRLEETHIPTMKELFKKLKSYESRGNDMGHTLYAVGETVADTKKNKKDFILERHRQIVQNVISRSDLSKELEGLESKLSEALVIERDNEGKSSLTYRQWEERINNYMSRLKEAVEGVYEDNNFGKYSDELRSLVESHVKAINEFYEASIIRREEIEVESSHKDLSMAIINGRLKPKIDAYNERYTEDIEKPRAIFVREFIRAIRDGTAINNGEEYRQDQKRYGEYQEAAVALYGENSQYERFIKRSQEINEIERRIGEIKEEEFLLLQKYQNLVYNDFNEISPYTQLSQRSFIELIEDVLKSMSSETVQGGADSDNYGGTSNRKALENLIDDWKSVYNGVASFLPVSLPKDLSTINYPTEEEIQLMNQWILE